MRSLTAGFGTIFAALVHDSARGDPAAAARHRGFIVSHVAGGCIALVLMPAYLAVYGQPTLLEALAFAWFASPIAIALFLSFTGRYAAANLLAIANLTGLVAFAAALTGGPASFFVPWIVVIPFEAALSRTRRIVLAAIALACLALLALVALDLFALLPPAPAGIGDTPLPLIAGAAVAAVYAGGLALSLQRAGDEAERAAGGAGARFRFLADAAPDMISRHSANGAATFVSAAAEPLLGLPAGELAGDGFLERVCPADRHLFLAAVARAAQGGAGRVELRLVPAQPAGAADGTVWVEMHCRPLATASGAIGVGGEVIAITRDIGERMRRERELERLRAEAESASLARARRLSHMGHDLRTPLNAIIGFADMLAAPEGSRLARERQVEYARIIRDSGQRLLGLVSDLLDVSRLEAGTFEIDPQPFDFAATVDACCAGIAPQADAAGLALHCRVEDGLGEVVADERACRQILGILLASAVTSTRPGGAVSLAARARDGQAVLSVEATGGAGPAPDGRSDGAALGLSLAQGLVRVHGGRFEADSMPGRGTRVTVILPLAPAASGSRPAADIVRLKRSA